MLRTEEASFDRRVARVAQWPIDRALPGLARVGRAMEPAERTIDRLMGSIQSRPLFDSPWVREHLPGILAPLWFALLATPLFLGYITEWSTVFFDARLYMASTRAWLQGANPWEVHYHGVYYSAPPPSLLPLAPFAVLPAPIDWQVLGLFCVGATILTIRMLRLPWWWLLFPPVVQGVLSGNVQMLLIPLILRGGGWLAGLLKIYALVPLALLGMWRHVAATLVLILLTVPILPWGTYIASFNAINDRLQTQTGYGMSFQQSVILLLPAAAALAVIGREKAAWLAVPALWPSQQWYYSSLALPLRSALVGAVIAIPTSGSGALALFVYAIAVIARRRRDDRRRQAPEPTSVA